MSIELVLPLNCFILCHPLLLLHSLCYPHFIDEETEAQRWVAAYPRTQSQLIEPGLEIREASSRALTLTECNIQPLGLKKQKIYETKYGKTAESRQWVYGWSMQLFFFFQNLFIFKHFHDETVEEKYSFWWLCNNVFKDPGQVKRQTDRHTHLQFRKESKC